MSDDDGLHITRELELIRNNAEMIGDAIRSAFEDTLKEPVPDKLKALIAELRARETGNAAASAQKTRIPPAKSEKSPDQGGSDPMTSA